jgi:hypothetical protein
MDCWLSAIGALGWTVSPWRELIGEPLLVGGGAWSEHVRQINVPHHMERSINEIIWNVT